MTRSKRHFCQTVSAILAGIVCALAGCDRSGRIEPGQIKHVILITLDTTRADRLSCYGSTAAPTTHIDQLAKQGTLFAHCASASPSTLPSHASMMTGCYPFKHGARANSGFKLADQQVTLAEQLSNAGWVTHAEIAAPVLGPETGISQGFATIGDQMKTIKVSSPQDKHAYEIKQRTADDITVSGIQFIRAHRQERFFLWLHYFDPHRPYIRHPQFEKLTGGDAYQSEILYTDFQIHRVISEIERLELRENTLVILTADHGESNGEHGEETHSFLVYNSTIRAPLILWGGGVPEGRRIDALVRTVDIYPTIMSVAGLPIGENIHARSLIPLFGGIEDDGRLAYGESIEGYTVFGSSILRYLREGHLKYIHKVNPELYDLQSDPGETRNLASQRPDDVAQFQSQLHHLIASTDTSGSDGRAPMSAESQSALRSLGYVGASPSAALDDELSLLEPRGPDPMTRIEDLKLFSEGWTGLRQKRYEQAIARFAEGFKRNPDSVPMLELLIDSYWHADRKSETLSLLKKGIELSPDSVHFRVQIAELLELNEAYDESISHLEHALKIDPDSAVARVRMGIVLHKKKDYARQIAVLREGAQRGSDSIELFNNLAYALATCPIDSLRDGSESVQFATRALKLSGERHPSILDTLAAAYAEAGQFDNAIQTAQEALAVFERLGAAESVAKCKSNIERFRKHTPLRSPDESN